MKEKIIIGVDVGGTKIMTGAITSDGKVIGKPIKVDTGSSDAAGIIVKRIIDSVENLLKEIDVDIKNVIGIGLGVTGPLDIKNGIILECPQLPTMNFFPLRKTLEEYFPVPIFMNNDANCLIYGETIFGVGISKENVIGFTLGTGIGCAIVINKKILNGSTDTAGEVWTSPYKGGIIEDYISGSGVTKIYKSISGKTKTSLEVFKLAEEKEGDALQAWQEFGEHLAVAVAWSVNLIDPEVVVLGGSISKAHPFFIEAFEKNLRKQICPVPSEKTKVVIAKLGDYSGFIGAASLVLEKN